MTKNVANQKLKDAIKRKNIGSAQNMNRQNDNRATLIRPTKFISKSRDAIKRRTIGKRNRTISNYARN